MDYSNTMEKSRPRSLPRVMTVSVTLKWPGSEFMSIVPVTTKGSGQSPENVLLFEDHTTTKAREPSF